MHAQQPQRILLTQAPENIAARVRQRLALLQGHICCQLILHIWYAIVPAVSPACNALTAA